MDRSIKSRIEAMARSDKITAMIFTVAMWVVLVFTFFAVYRIAPTTEVAAVLGVALILLGGFNTASMIAMIQGFAKDKDFIYREDILNLDRNKQGKHPSVAAEPVREPKERAQVVSSGRK